VKTPISLRWLGLGLVLAGLLILTPPSYSQCLVTNTVVNPGSYNQVVKYLNGTYQCYRVASNNVSLCAPAVPFLRTRITASAAAMYTNPTCQIYCTGGCGTITIDGSDGLPVELMDFTVD